MTGSWVVFFGVLAVVMLALGQKEAAIGLGAVTVMLAVINGIVFALFHSLTVPGIAKRNCPFIRC